MNRISTPNILEVAYLLERHHHIAEVGTKAGWPYGIEELAVTLEGEHIDLDHGNFLRHSRMTDLTGLTAAFAAVQQMIDRQAEAGAGGGLR